MSDKAHAKFGASSSDRWMNCPGSVALSEKAPPEAESRYAKEGTDAHHCLEEFLQAYIKGDSLSDVRYKLIDSYPRDMVTYAEDAAEHIITMRERTPEADLLCETKVDLGFIHKDEFGTVDASIVDIFGELTVIDFKYGQGVVVDPADNSQLIYYALGIAHKYDYEFTSVKLVVIQPRAFSEEGTVREWSMPVAALQDWARAFKEGIKACLKPNALLNAGDHCKFCRAKTICPELTDVAVRDAQAEFGDVTDEPELKVLLPDAKTLNANLHKVLPALDKIEVWMKAVREYAFERLRTGHEVKGFKLVAKRGLRQWKSDDAEFVKLACNTFTEYFALKPKEVISPAQLEKVMGKGKTKDLTTKFIAEHAHAPSSGLTMVAESDKRPASGSPQTDFDDVTEDDLFSTEIIKVPPEKVTMPAPKTKTNKKQLKHLFSK